MIYKSSPQTFFFKYIFPVAMAVGGIIGLIASKNEGNEVSSNFANAFGIALLWVSIFLVQMPFRIKKIEVDENGVKVKSRNNDQFIPFKNIISVSMFDLSNPWMLTIKYLDVKKAEKKKISYMPNAKYQRFMKNDKMTEYLIEQAKANNPNFQTSNTFKNILILFIAGLPFFIGMIYYMSKIGF